jgi:hypothetical protein
MSGTTACGARTKCLPYSASFGPPACDDPCVRVLSCVCVLFVKNLLRFYVTDVQSAYSLVILPFFHLFFVQIGMCSIPIDLSPRMRCLIWGLTCRARMCTIHRGDKKAKDDHRSDTMWEESEEMT